MQVIRILIAVIVLSIVGSMVWQGQRPAPPPAPLSELRRSGERLRVALTGDILAAHRFSAESVDPGVMRVLQDASLAIADLDQPAVVSGPATGGRPEWPAAGDEALAALRTLGFGIVTTANDHAGGVGGRHAEATRQRLQHAGLRVAGIGRDLNEAREPAAIGTSPRVAVLSVSTSVPADARATRARGDIAGRPGVSAIRYAPVITAAPPAFAAFAEMARTLAPDALPSADGTLTISGKVIRPGARTGVELIPDGDDVRELLDLIRTTRTQADVVILSLHAHEPGNRSEIAEGFVRELARHAVDAGAVVVSAHGPRQLRGAEAYNGGVIFYSLGNFVFQPQSIAPGSETIFDSDVSAYDVALDAIQPAASTRLPDFEESFWWESALVLLEFDGGTPRSVAVTPLDLMDGGTPRVAIGDRAGEILERLVRLSAPLGTNVTIEAGRGVINLVPGQASPAR